MGEEDFLLFAQLFESIQVYSVELVFSVLLSLSSEIYK